MILKKISKYNVYKYYNLYEIDKFYEKQIQKEVDNSNHPISIKQIEFAIKNPYTQNTKDLDDLTGIFYETFKEINNTNSNQIFQKIEKEGIPSTNFEASITLIPKTRQRHYNKTADEYPS